MSEEKLYAKRNIIAQGEEYVKHVSAMTGEGLHSKSDIAAELAHRDIEIKSLRKALISCQKQFDFYTEQHRAKGTDEGRVKAATNANFAIMCEKALTTNRA